jgi:hypothetical protein
MISQFERFSLVLTKEQGLSASHQGQCDEDVRALSEVPAIARQLRLLRPEDVAAELKEYGAWDAEELADHAQNVQRILWLAAGNIREES